MKTNIANIKVFPPGMVQVSHISKENASRSILKANSSVDTVL